MVQTEKRYSISELIDLLEGKYGQVVAMVNESGEEIKRIVYSSGFRGFKDVDTGNSLFLNKETLEAEWVIIPAEPVYIDEQTARKKLSKGEHIKVTYDNGETEILKSTVCIANALISRSFTTFHNAKYEVSTEEFNNKKERKTRKRVDKEMLFSIHDLKSKGYLNKDIAKRLGISESTVSNRLKNRF